MRLIFVQTQLGVLHSFLQLFASFVLGLGWMLAAWHTRSHGQISDSFRLWLRIFALSVYGVLALGVMTLVQIGLVLPMSVALMGNVLGPWLLVAVLTAFVIKSTTFGVVLYSRHRVSVAVFRFCLIATAFGVTMIVLAMSVMESWMRAPAGAVLLDGQFRIHDWLEISANPQLIVQLAFVGLCVLLLLSSAVIAIWACQTRNAVSQGEPNRQVRLAGWAGWLGLVLIVPLYQAIVTGQWTDFSATLAWLSGRHFVTAFGNGAGALPVVMQLVLLLWILHALILAVAARQMRVSRLGGQPHYQRLMALLGVTGPALCLLFWWLSQEVKQDDMVAGVLTFEDLMGAASETSLLLGLLVCVFLMIVILSGWVKLVRQAVLEGVKAVHRPGVVLS